MTEKISAKDLESMQGQGAKVVRKPGKAAPGSEGLKAVNKSIGQLSQAVAVAGKTDQVIALASEKHLNRIASALGDGQKHLLEQLKTILSRDGQAKVIPYRFTVRRDSRGLIEHIDAHPIRGE